jgi:alpha-glucoside transport system substrate-binding protein
MKFFKTAAAVAALAVLAGTPAAFAATSTAAKPKSLLNGKIACKNQYKGKKVNIFSPNDTVGDIKSFAAAWAPFEKCTGVKISWEGTKTFEADVKLRLQGGNAPGVIDFPQPGLMAVQAKAGKLIALPADISADISKNMLGGWLGYSTVDGKVYGEPFRQNFKSFVWYSPKAFAAKGYKIPQSLDELKALSDQIVKDGGTPWCAGIESGAATGWVITDWVEDMMLRTTTPANYDAWVNHTLKFNSPEVKTAFDAVGSYLKNEKYVGNVKAIATTRFQDGGLPILDGKCFMHRQANFYKSNWPAGTTFGDSGTVNAFYLPMAKATDPKAMLGGGDINAATNKKPETFDTIRYLASVDWANATAANMGNFSPRTDYDTSLLPDKFDQVFANIGKSAAVFRFDASDLMPGAVGAGSFWKEATSWITGQSTDDTLANIDKSWPAS